MTEPLFLSVPETAELLGISRDLVYDLIARHELPAAAFGGRRMVPRRAIELVLEQAMTDFDPARILASTAEAGSPSTPGLPLLVAPGSDGESTSATGSRSAPSARVAPMRPLAVAR